jgi:hypothetical protein
LSVIGQVFQKWKTPNECNSLYRIIASTCVDPLTIQTLLVSDEFFLRYKNSKSIVRGPDCDLWQSVLLRYWTLKLLQYRLRSTLYVLSFWKTLLYCYMFRHFGLCPTSGILQNVRFRKLDLFPSSGEKVGHIHVVGSIRNNWGSHMAAQKCMSLTSFHLRMGTSSSRNTALFRLVKKQNGQNPRGQCTKSQKSVILNDKEKKKSPWS